MSKRTTLFIRIFSLNLLLLLLSTFLFQTCSDDNSPTEPEAQSSLAAATIGNGGGTLTTEELELSVPPGAFTTDTKITLSLIKEDAGFGNELSKEYKFEGVPQTFTKPLTIKMKYDGDLTDSSYIAIGENTFIKSLNAENISYRLLSARDSSGYLVAAIPPAYTPGLLKGSSNSSLNEDKLAFSVLAIAGYSSYISEQKHFKIDFPSSVPTEAYDLASYLETAYSKFKGLGFSYNKRTKWPVEVTVKRLKSTVSGYSMNSMWGDDYGYMEFNFDKIGNAEEMKVTAGHEFFHLVQSLYDPRNRFSKAKFQSENLWIHEALSVWSEGLFSGDENYVSNVFLTSADMVYYGANSCAGNDANKYGYGMAAFIKYITDENGNEILVKIYDEILKGNNSFVAIDNVIPDNTYLIWVEFLEKYLAYNIYSGKDFEPGSLANEAIGTGGKFVIRYDADTLKTFSKKYKNLSAVMYSVRTVGTSLSAIDENSQLDFKIDGNIIGDILLFKENDSECVFLKEGFDSVKLDNFKSISDAGYVIIAAVANSRLITPYNGITSGTLTIKVRNKEKTEPAPIITNIFDYSYYAASGDKRNFTVNDKVFRITGDNFKEVQKILINGIESSRLDYVVFDSTYIDALQSYPTDFTGHLNIQVVTSSGESNEFPYLYGFPIDYINSTDSLTIENRFTVKYYDSEGNDFIKKLELTSGFSNNQIAWDNNVASISLSNISGIAGSIKFIFSKLENGTIEKIVMDYTSEIGYPCTLHYEGVNVNVSDEWNYMKNDKYNYTKSIFKQTYTVGQPTISGTIGYYDSPVHEYRDATYNELHLSGSYENCIIINLYHFPD